MGTLKASFGGSTKARTPSTHLKGYWPAHDGSGNLFAERSGLTNDLNANGTVSAGLWTDPAHPSFEATATDYFSDGSLTDIELGGANTSSIISLRLNLAATTATASSIWAKQNSTGQNAGINLTVAEISLTTALRSEYKIDGTASKNVVAGGAIDDGLDHHVVVFHDRGGNRGIYVDGADAVTGGVIDMTDSVLVQAATADAAQFIVGARGVTGTVNTQLAGVNATQKMKVWDVQAYTVEGSLPSNYLDLIGWMYKHPYSYITADMW